MKKNMTKLALTITTFSLVAAGTLSTIVEDKGASSTPEFSEVPFPVTDADKRKIQATSKIIVDGKSYAIGFNTILRSGDKVSNNTFGVLYDQTGVPVTNRDGSIHISVDNDFSSLLPVGKKLFMISHFESRPGAMYVSELEQNKKSGKLKAITTQNIDFSQYGGLWVPCAGSVTPWNTHLGSEEYPNNARLTESAKSMDDIEKYDKPMARYFGLNPYSRSTTVADFKNIFKPYRYGYPIEITVTKDGDATPVKHFAMGRVAVELAYVMSDMRTTYISDDGTNVGFFMFIADTKKDLSKGTLYAAKWNQVHGRSGGFADLTWVNLGHANDQNIQNAIESGITFSDIFTTGTIKDGSCEEGFISINTTDGHECLQLKDGMNTIASRLETRRYAAMMGATTEFRKEEGITFDPKTNTLYVAMGEIAKGMAASSKYDKGGPDHIQLPKNKCGVVYALDIKPDISIDSNYVAANMYGIVSGIEKQYAKDGDYANNTCDINGIANPDNITFMNGRDTLIIGEDTGSGHQNDAIWSYNMGSQKLTRILTSPYGSETTSTYYYPDINGFAYLMGVIQHPYGDSDEDKLRDPSESAAYTGYIGVMPVMN